MTNVAPAKRTALTVLLSLIYGALRQCGWICASASVMGLLSDYFPLELMTHFRIVFALVLGLVVVASLIVLISKKYKPGIPFRTLIIETVIFSLLFILNTAMIVQLYAPVTAAVVKSPSDQILKILQINILEPNQNYKEVVDLVRAQAPDIVSFEEVGLEWGKELGANLTEYPFKQLYPEEGFFGLAIFSKFPIKAERIVLSKLGIPILRAEIDVNGTKLNYVAVHTLPPVEPTYFADRNEEMSQLAVMSKSMQGPIILAGDFNCTPWSNAFGRLCRDGNLRDSEQSFGPQPSWPSYLGFPLIPIDHFLVSPEIVVNSRSVLQDVGSDHYPVLMNIIIPKPKGS